MLRLTKNKRGKKHLLQQLWVKTNYHHIYPGTRNHICVPFGNKFIIMHAQLVLKAFLLCVQRERGSALKSQENFESEP